MAIAARNVVTIEMIYTKIDSLQIFEKYCAGFSKCDCKFSSELRDDPDPSCSISWLNGDYLYHDFGNGDSFRAINYVMTKYSINYFDALCKIQQDFNLILDPTFTMTSLGNSSDIRVEGSNVSKGKKTPKIIQIKSRNFNALDKSYWYDRYAIHSTTLQRFNVIPIQEFWINKANYLAAKHAYSYEFYWENGIFRRKLYQPFLPVDDGKWYSNGGVVVQGEGMLPYKGELLIITKSLKDVMALSELGYIAIAPTSESSWLPESYFTKQATRFDRLIILFDNDKIGIQKSIAFSERYNIPSIAIPTELQGCKDVSDTIYNKGIDFTDKLIKELL